MMFDWAWFYVTLHALLVNSQVYLQPNDSQVIPIGESRTITCTLNTGITFVGWSIVFMNAETVSIENDISPLPGVTTVTQSLISTLTLNTSNTGITSIACIGIQTAQVMLFKQRINVTIFGAPDPPTNISLLLTSSRLEVSWKYKIIESVAVTFNLSLTYLNPSALQDYTTEVTDTRNATFTLLGNRSCDPFRFCIAGRNSVGRGENSCTVGNLPYVPPLDRIQYSLSKRNGKFVLSVTVTIPVECQSSEARYILLMRSLLSNDTRSSQQVPVTQMSMLEIGNLSDGSSHKFTVVSMNAIGEGRSKEISFSINCIRGITICSAVAEDNFRVSCDYVSGCEDIGCTYIITGDNDVTNMEGTISPNGYSLFTANISSYNSVTVNNSDNNVVTEPLVSSSVESCSSTTEMASTTLNDSASTSSTTLIIVIAVVVAIVVATILIVIVVTACICVHYRANSDENHNANMNGKGENQNKFQNSDEFDTNPSYGVTSLCEGNIQCDINPSYEVPKRNLHSVVSNSQHSPCILNPVQDNNTEDYEIVS